MQPFCLWAGARGVGSVDLYSARAHSSAVLCPQSVQAAPVSVSGCMAQTVVCAAE